MNMGVFTPPVGFSRNGDVIEIRGHDVAKSRKFREVARSGRAAFAVDDVASKSPRRVRSLPENDGSRSAG
jgi:pyridoxamine 5'-phosphate oxidase family protein